MHTIHQVLTFFPYFIVSSMQHYCCIIVEFLGIVGKKEQKEATNSTEEDWVYSKRVNVHILKGIFFLVEKKRNIAAPHITKKCSPITSPFVVVEFNCVFSKVSLVVIFLWVSYQLPKANTEGRRKRGTLHAKVKILLAELLFVCIWEDEKGS